MIFNQKCFESEVGVNCLKVGVLGAYYNVMTNVNEVKDQDFKNEVIMA